MDKFYLASALSALAEKERELAEAQIMLKRLAPTGKIDGLDIDGWKSRADALRQSLATKTQEVADLTERVEKMKEEIGQAMDEYDMGAEATARARLDRLTATPSPKCPECERKP